MSGSRKRAPRRNGEKNPNRSWNRCQEPTCRYVQVICKNANHCIDIILRLFRRPLIGPRNGRRGFFLNLAGPPPRMGRKGHSRGLSLPQRGEAQPPVRVHSDYRAPKGRKGSCGIRVPCAPLGLWPKRPVFRGRRSRTRLREDATACPARLPPAMSSATLRVATRVLWPRSLQTRRPSLPSCLSTPVSVGCPLSAR